ncbi:hypothetical protein [Flavihumibacter solisilvae]|nr:hypothetical protein [Flavihumibacter solisilvae]
MKKLYAIQPDPPGTSGGDSQKHPNESDSTKPDYGQQQAVDKAPGEERGQKEKVTPDNLKGKKVDADPDIEADKPLNNP